MKRLFEFRPHIGIDQIEFGFSKDQVRSFFDEKPIYSAVVQWDGYYDDWFFDRKLIFIYDRMGCLTAIEMQKPCHLIYKGIDISMIKLENAEGYIKSISSQYSFFENKFKIDEIGLILRVTPKNISGVLVYEKTFDSKIDAVKTEMMARPPLTREDLYRKYVEKK